MNTQTLYFRKEAGYGVIDTYTENSLSESFDEVLDECYPCVEMMGMTFTPSRILAGDEIARRESFLNYLDGEYCSIEVDWETYLDVVTNSDYRDTYKDVELIEHDEGDFVVIGTTRYDFDA